MATYFFPSFFRSLFFFLSFSFVSSRRVKSITSIFFFFGKKFQNEFFF